MRNKASLWGIFCACGALMAVAMMTARTAAEPASSQTATRVLTVKPIARDTLAAEAFDPAQSAALFVGVRLFYDEEDKPSDKIVEVPYAADDAVDLAGLFVNDLNLVTAPNVTLALSGEPQKAESQARLKALLAAGAKRSDARFTSLLRLVTKTKNAAGEKGLLIISFATHGFTQDGDRLLGQDSVLADLDMTGLPVARILDDVSSSRAPRRLVFLDACRERVSPSRAVAVADPKTVISMSDSFRKALADAKGAAILSGATAGGFSYDDATACNGVFTAQVLAGLRGAAPADSRGFITPQTLAGYVDAQVKQWVEVHRPDRAGQSAGIGLNVDDARCGQMPLAVDPAATEKAKQAAARRDRLIEVLRKHQDGERITGAMVDEIVKGLKASDASKAEPLLAKLELLDKTGVSYAEDFALWWDQRGRKSFTPEGALAGAGQSGVPPNKARGILLEAIGFLTGTNEKGVDHAKTKELFLKASEMGNPLAKMWIALLTNQGICGIREDKNEGERLAGEVIGEVRRLAEQNDQEALNLLGYAYEIGLGVMENQEQAVACYRKAAVGGNIDAMDNLGRMYKDGKGVAQDGAQALAWFSKAVESGEASSMFHLATLYVNGVGVAQDDAQAVAWYRKAAEKGEPSGMRNLGVMYENGKGVPQDDAQAVAWYRKAAEKGQATAMQNLGWMYKEGKGVAQDDAQAVAWYRKAAEKGEPSGMYELGVMYENGKGVPQDDTQAISWYRKAAERGNNAGMNNLGAMYFNGKGVPQDDTQAVAWFRKAAEKGSSVGMNNLGWIYEEGRGVAKDIDAAVSWYQKAARLGSEKAKENLKRLGKSW